MMHHANIQYNSDLSVLVSIQFLRHVHKCIHEEAHVHALTNKMFRFEIPKTCSTYCS